MALRAVPEHPKFAALQASLSLRKHEAMGILELLWHFTGKYAPQGNVGRFPDAQIEAWIGWEGERGTLIAGLVAEGWLDLSVEHRLIVHDWHEHADTTTRKQLGRKKLAFLSGHIQDMSDRERKVSSPPEPVPAPAPEPEPDGKAPAFDSSMVAQAVMTECGIGGMRTRIALEEVSRMEIEKGAVGLELSRTMSERWLHFERNKPQIFSTAGPEKFFADGMWRDPDKWPWKPGGENGKPEDNRNANRVSPAVERQTRSRAGIAEAFGFGNGEDSSGSDGTDAGPVCDAGAPSGHGQDVRDRMERDGSGVRPSGIHGRTIEGHS